MYKDFIRECQKTWNFAGLGKYEDWDINDLALECCKAIDTKDEYKRNVFMSGLMLRYNFVILKQYEKSKTTNIDKEDMIPIIYEAIHYTFKARAWEKNKKLTPKSCIMTTISSRGANRLLYESNQIKSCANYNLMPLPTDEDGDVKLDWLEATYAQDEKVNSNGGGEAVVQYLINNKQPVEAIIIDTLMNSAAYRKVSTRSCKYKEAPLIKALTGLSTEYNNYFKAKYKISKEELSAATETISNSSRTRLQTLVKKTLAGLKEDKTVLKYLLD